MPKTPAHHAALGLFVDKWGVVETRLTFLFQKLLGADIASANIAFGNMTMRGFTKALASLGTMKLNDDGIAALTSLIERTARLNSKRNVIVHGHWALDVVFWAYKKTQVRASIRLLRRIVPDDHRENKLFGNIKNQKIRGKYSVTPKQLIAAQLDAISLSNDLSKFTQAVEGYFLTEYRPKD
jgi:hypothetical protein